MKDPKNSVHTVYGIVPMGAPGLPQFHHFSVTSYTIAEGIQDYPPSQVFESGLGIWRQASKALIGKQELPI